MLMRLSGSPSARVAPRGPASANANGSPGPSGAAARWRRPRAAPRRRSSAVALRPDDACAASMSSSATGRHCSAGTAAAALRATVGRWIGVSERTCARRRARAHRRAPRRAPCECGRRRRMRRSGDAAAMARITTTTRISTSVKPPIRRATRPQPDARRPSLRAVTKRRSPGRPKGRLTMIFRLQRRDAGVMSSGDRTDAFCGRSARDPKIRYRHRSRCRPAVGAEAEHPIRRARRGIHVDVRASPRVLSAASR